MDPWKICQQGIADFEEKTQTKFEDNFSPEVQYKLPDHDTYLASLESKLKKIKANPNLLQQLQNKREFYMRQLLSEEPQLQSETNQQISNLEEPIQHSEPYTLILRSILPEKQALSQGEIIDFIKYDQLVLEDQNTTGKTKDQQEEPSSMGH